MGQTGQLRHDHGRHLGKATGVTRAAVVCTIDIPFSVTTYDKIYRLLDVGKFQVVNPRVPEAKPPEIFFAPTLLELQHVTGVPLVQQAAAQTTTDAEDPAVPEAAPATREQKRFNRYDKDRDGRITRDEYLAARRKAFAKLDANGDGRLSFDEWAIKATTKFAAADKDASGAMTAAEFATTAVKRKAPSRAKCPPPQQAPSEES